MRWSSGDLKRLGSPQPVLNILQMHRSIARCSAALLLVFCQTAAVCAETPASESAKKGLAGWGRGHRQKVAATWYYNWMPQPDRDGGTAEFVPMVKGDNFNWQLEKAKKHVGVGKPLLCLNEPERADQGNMTVERALEVWPRLMETGARLGSPAPSSDGKGMAWLERFMAEVKNESCASISSPCTGTAAPILRRLRVG